MDEYEYDEGSDIDNWETEQVFRDHEGDDDEDDTPPKDPSIVEVTRDTPVDQFFADLLKMLDMTRH